MWLDCTGELTPTLFCFAAYTPMQPPIIVGLLTATSPATIAFWQWFNQSYNAAVFYANKSVSAPMSNPEIFAAYCAAVTAALSVGMGTRALGAWLAMLLLLGRHPPAALLADSGNDHRCVTANRETDGKRAARPRLDDVCALLWRGNGGLHKPALHAERRDSERSHHSGSCGCAKHAPNALSLRHTCAARMTLPAVLGCLHGTRQETK